MTSVTAKYLSPVIITKLKQLCQLDSIHQTFDSVRFTYHEILDTIIDTDLSSFPSTAHECVIQLCLQSCRSSDEELNAEGEFDESWLNIEEDICNRIRYGQYVHLYEHRQSDRLNNEVIVRMEQDIQSDQALQEIQEFQAMQELNLMQEYENMDEDENDGENDGENIMNDNENDDENDDENMNDNENDVENMNDDENDGENMNDNENDDENDEYYEYNEDQPMNDTLSMNLSSEFDEEAIHDNSGNDNDSDSIIDFLNQMELNEEEEEEEESDNNNHSYNNITCLGCIEDQPNQLAHMDIGGCLYCQDSILSQIDIVDETIIDNLENISLVL